MSDVAGPMFAEGARGLQDHFDSRRIADRLVERMMHHELTDADVELIEAQSSVLISTVDVEGWPDVSYKGGDVGFIRVVDRQTLEFASFDGNGMFRTLGNIVDTGKVGVLFLDTARQKRLRLHGTAQVLTDREAVSRYAGAQAVVRITIGRLFPNCGRYIHTSVEQISEFVPRDGYDPPVPSWKSYPDLKDALPADQL